MRPSIFVVFILLFSLFSCKKDTVELIPDNKAPYFGKIPSVKVKNYVNRLYIDLIGREPTDVESENATSSLMASNTDIAGRIVLVEKLMTDTTFLVGDTSYTLAYHKRIYNLLKLRFLEGISDDELRQGASISRFAAYSDSLSGNMTGYALNMAEYMRTIDVLSSRTEYFNKLITVSDCYARMVNNSVYDFIHMNTFNFVNACFNDLLYRFPTQAEFQVSFAMAEDNVPGNLFSQSGQTKNEFINIISNSNECKQGTIIWIYQNLLARTPSTQETEIEMQQFGQDGDLQKLQLRILISNEYANF
jgi:hypothetical protein